MLHQKWMLNSFLSLALGLILTCGVTADELTTNGGFEGDGSGSLDGWAVVSSGTQAFLLGPAAPGSGSSFGAFLTNGETASGTLARQEFIGIGDVNPGDALLVSFDAAGSFAAGGVGIVEFFSEVDGGGTSASEILGGGPLFSGDGFFDWTNFEFSVIAGPDVSNGVTLQFGAVTGGASGSQSVLFIDNVSVSVVPEPAAATLLRLGGLGLLVRRRR